jgi:hypothetical protein
VRARKLHEYHRTTGWSARESPLQSANSPFSPKSNRRRIYPGRHAHVFAGMAATEQRSPTCPQQAAGMAPDSVASHAAPRSAICIGKVMCMHAQVCDYQAIDRSTILPGCSRPRGGEFYHVRAPDDRRSTARHNSIGAPNPRGFSGNLTTGCQFSHWRAVVWRVPNAPRCAFGRMTSRPKMGIKVCAILLRDAADPTA